MDSPLSHIFSIPSNGAIFSYLYPTKQNFEDVKTETKMSTAIIIGLVIGIIIYILIAIAIYKITNSWTNTILYLLFGIFYLIFAIIYWGFSGYKICK